MAEFTGGELVARVLKQAGVGHVFTLCGGHILPIYDGCVKDGIGVIDVRHEQAAAHAADAYARLTRNVGVAIVTAGPGVTDAVTGVANAQAARSPLLLIGGAAPLGLRGLGALQEMEQVALLRPITKGAWSVAETRQIPEVLTTAIRTALSGRPGPVFVEIPVDLLLNTIEDRLAPIPTGYVHRTPMAADPAADIDDKERGYHARNALDSIRNVANYLGSIRGRRKAIVYFSEGIDYDINNMFSDQITEAQSVMDATREMIAAATRANVVVYAVDPRGLGAEFQDMASIQSFPDDTSLGLGMSSIFNEVRLSQDSLRVMGEETGGFAVVNQNSFRDAFQRIVDDNSSYYVMGYYSSNDRRDGRFRKIEVKLPNRPGLTVRARKGYVATP